jgi:hypothetical protein
MFIHNYIREITCNYYDYRIGAVTFLFATENSKPNLAQFVATLGDKEKAEVNRLQFSTFVQLSITIDSMFCSIFFDSFLMNVIAFL